MVGWFHRFPACPEVAEREKLYLASVPTSCMDLTWKLFSWKRVPTCPTKSWNHCSYGDWGSPLVSLCLHHLPTVLGKSPKQVCLGLLPLATPIPARPSKRDRGDHSNNPSSDKRICLNHSSICSLVLWPKSVCFSSFIHIRVISSCALYVNPS